MVLHGSQSVRQDDVLGVTYTVVLHGSQSVRQDDVLGVTNTVVLHGSQSVRQDDVLGVTYTVVLHDSQSAGKDGLPSVTYTVKNSFVVSLQWRKSPAVNLCLFTKLYTHPLSACLTAAPNALPPPP